MRIIKNWSTHINMPLQAPPSEPTAGHATSWDAVDESLTREAVIGTAVDVVEWNQALERVHAWVKNSESHYVCFCNVHALVTARLDPLFSSALGHADLVVPDGAPVAWTMRRLGHIRQPQIRGTDFFWNYCAIAAERSESIFLLGSKPDTLTRLQARLRTAFPRLLIAGAYSPPFRPLTEDEDRAIVGAIIASGAGTVWVSLGCPKQELWMAAHYGAVPAVMLGVGAAFAFKAATVREAPHWMRAAGLEWLHRLCNEPRRLLLRYFVTNTVFLLLGGRQLLSPFYRRMQLRLRQVIARK